MELKFTHNRLNKEAAMAQIQQEDFARKTISFYRYTKIEDPKALRESLFREWAALGCLGRIYIAQEGINAQMNVPEPQWDAFVANLESRAILKDMMFKHAVEDFDSFWKLTIKVKHKIVADGIEDPNFDASDVGTHLEAEEFHAMMDDPDAIPVDFRNFYESEVGHFEGAVCPDSATFREELPMAAQMLEGQEDKKLLLYCTGGIRCEKASSYMKSRGFRNVYQLHGGIIEYAHKIKEKGLKSKFKGKNFVFDERIGERVTDDVLTTCHQCGKSCDDQTNCKNKACNLLFVQCDACQTTHENCCSEVCQSIVKLPEADQRAAWKQYEKSDPLSLGRNPFRRSKV